MFGFYTRTYLKIHLSEQFRHASDPFSVAACFAEVLRRMKGWHPELSEMTGFLPPQE
jgi:hypothetical protein